MDYCGTETTAWVIDFFPKSCMLHDRCFSSTAPIMECNVNFLKDMYAEHPSLLPIAIVYFIGVVAFGWYFRKDASASSADQKRQSPSE